MQRCASLQDEYDVLLPLSQARPPVTDPAFALTVILHRADGYGSTQIIWCRRAGLAHAPPCKALHFPPCRSLHFIINWASPKHLPPKASFVVVKTFRFACESKAAGAGPRAVFTFFAIHAKSQACVSKTQHFPSASVVPLYFLRTPARGRHFCRHRLESR